MNTGGNREGEPSEPSSIGPIDRWEGLLVQMAEDVHALRSLVTVAMVTGWLLFLGLVARIIFD